MSLAPGARVGRYEVRSTLGVGGMGEVYLAHDPSLRRNVALKILPDAYAGDADRKERFLREATTASSLSHPNVAVVYEAGQTDEGRAFLTMEHVSGDTLAHILQSRKLSIGEILDIGIQIADALDEARHLRIVHRDLKPGNIMIDTRDRVKILDFGIAKALQPEGDVMTNAPTAADSTEAGVVVGTAAYMSPEQAAGQPVDHRSDLFSLGAVLYELVSGKRALQRPHPERLTTSRSDCPAELERIIARCLEQDRERRYQTARELLLDLQSLRSRIASKGNSQPQDARRRTAQILAAVSALPVVALVALFLYRKPAATPAVAVPPVAPRIASVAVLPFVNVSAAPEAEFVTDGLTDEVINALAQLPDLKVVSRTSAFAFKGTKDDVREIARKLDVQSVVEGTVRRSGNRLRVTAQLIAAKDGYHLWSDTYERELIDVFAVQNEIASSVARALQAKLTSGQKLVVAPTNDVAAYELYLRGRQASAVWTNESLSKAISFFQQAIERDPSFALPYAGLAEAYSLIDHAVGARIMGDDEAYEKAIAAARKALELDPNSAEAHASLGHIFIHQGRFAESERHLKRAVALNPNSSYAYQWFGVLFTKSGRLDEGAAMHEKAKALDPLSTQVHLLLVSGGMIRGNFEGAIERGRHAVEIAPDHPGLYGYLVRAYALAGRFDEAMGVVDDAIRRMPTAGNLQHERALVLALANRRAEALAAIEAIPEKERWSSKVIVLAYAALGDKDRAIDGFERMSRDRPNFARINLDMPPHPAFDAVRADPRYPGLHKKLGIPVP